MTEQTSISPTRYRLREAAKRHGLSEWTLRQAAKERRCEHFLVGNRYEFFDEDVTNYLNSIRQPAVAA